MTTITFTNIDFNLIEREYGLTIRPTTLFPKTILNYPKLKVPTDDREVTPPVTSSKRIKYYACSPVIPLTVEEQSTIGLRYHCFWCRHHFDSMFYTCPIRKVPAKFEDQYKSVISGNTFLLNTLVDAVDQEHLREEKGEQITDHLYETDGVLCGIPCLKSFIYHNRHNPIYGNSLVLMYDMYSTWVDISELISQPEAPHWRMLNVYGGPYSLKQFRKTTNPTSIIGLHKNISVRPVGLIFASQL